jgi:phospholipase C
LRKVIRSRPEARFDPASGRLLITLRHPGEGPVNVTVTARDYLAAPARRHRLAPGAELADAWDLRASHHWYDFAVTAAHDPAFERRIAGHGEDGRPSLSDPALGRQA